MSRKALVWYEEQYLDALGYAQVLGCSLSLDQFAAAHRLEPQERDELREYCEARGIA